MSKPIPAMTLEERRQRIIKKKLKEQQAKIAEKDKARVPPVNRLSITGSNHWGSEDSEWIWVAGVGWYHSSEQLWFRAHYFQSSVSGNWFLTETSLETYHREGSISSDELNAIGWGVCSVTSRADKAENLHAATNGNGRKVTVHKDFIEEDSEYYFLCGLSGEWHHRDLKQRYSYPMTPAYKQVSKLSCKKRPDLYQVCQVCGKYQEVIGLISRPDAGSTMCNDCYTQHMQKNVIHKHDYTGYPNIITTNPTNKLLVKGKLTDAPDETVRLFGVECEVEIMDSSPFDRYRLAINAMNALGKDFVVMKNDGSLKNHPRESPLWGFEMVTAPADLATHRARWAKLEAMEGFKELRAWDTTTCGMHVHVGKAGLTTLQIGRIMTFITNKANRKFIEKIAGRNSAAACRFVDKGIDGGLKPDPDKYCAINIRPVHTIEFRIFRGTIRFQHIIRNLEFCEALCAFAHPASRSFSEFKDYKKFLKFCSMNRRQYPLLTKWMAHADQGYLKPQRVKPGSVADEVVEPVPTETRSQDKWY